MNYFNYFKAIRSLSYVSFKDAGWWMNQCVGVDAKSHPGAKKWEQKSNLSPEQRSFTLISFSLNSVVFKGARTGIQGKGAQVTFAPHIGGKFHQKQSILHQISPKIQVFLNLSKNGTFGAIFVTYIMEQHLF